MQQQNDSRCSCAKHWRHLKREAKQWCQIFVKCLLLHFLCSRLCWEELRCEDLQTEKGGCLSPVVPTLSCACLYLNLTLTDHLLCSQPAHLTHIHNQAQQWVSFLLFQSNSVVTHALGPAVGETLLGLKVKSLLFTQPWSSSLYSRIPPHSSPTLHRWNCSELPSGSHLHPVWQFSLQPLIHWSKEILSQKIWHVPVLLQQQHRKKDQWKIKRLGRIKKKNRETALIQKEKRLIKRRR